MAKNLDAIFGRLGNRMFQMAFLYAESRRRGVDFYFQDPKFFEGYEEEIKQLFGEGIGYLSQVGVHIRRGKNPSIPSEPNYSENPFYVNLADDTDYYERAMALFPDEKFLVFTDDVEYVKERFKGDNIQVMDKGDEVEDLNLFASTKHQIIANSSWSFWGAYLCPNEGHQVIAPLKWFSDGGTRTVCPDSWIKI